MAGGGVHRRQPAVPGRQAAAARPRRRLRRRAVRGLRRPRPARGRLRRPTGTRRRGRRSRRASRAAPACSPPRASAAVPTGGSSSGSRRPATSSSPGRTSRGSSPAPTSTSASSARTTAPKPSASSTASRSPSINANLTDGLDLTQARRLPREPRHRLHGRHEGRSVRHRRGDGRARCSRRPNPDGRSNRDVVRPWVNGLDITRPRRVACGSSTSASDMPEARGRPVRGAVRVRPRRVVRPRARKRHGRSSRATGGCTSEPGRRCAQRSPASRATSRRRI